MNDPTTLLISLKSLLALAGLWCLLFWLYRDYRLDVFRQELFALRDRLFDLARGRSLSFDHPVYGRLRRTINGFIRFGHRFTLLQVILLVTFVRREVGEAPETLGDRWDQLAVDLAADTRRELAEIVERMHQAVIKHLVLSSPLLILSLACILVPIWMANKGYFFLDRLVRRFGNSLRLIDSYAVANGA